MSRDDCLATAFGVSMSRAASTSRSRHEPRRLPRHRLRGQHEPRSLDIEDPA
ncbi:hypothetical protein MNZ22_16760 [Aeromonas encheleia]|uniref:hypothetical protein n=1 Tax=Aeromonas encheleia TaxID=73010 RepID=UPI001F59ECA6|nr:hypothetical protein [Aeromonas encheleia]UNP88247.1 hypothetical protein MNZ22_16760 [Aeromonas encheleia]